MIVEVIFLWWRHFENGTQRVVDLAIAKAFWGFIGANFSSTPVIIKHQ